MVNFREQSKKLRDDFKGRMTDLIFYCRPWIHLIARRYQAYFAPDSVACRSSHFFSAIVYYDLI